MASILRRQGEKHTERRGQREDEVRDWSDPSINRGIANTEGCQPPWETDADPWTLSISSDGVD